VRCDDQGAGREVVKHTWFKRENWFANLTKWLWSHEYVQHFSLGKWVCMLFYFFLICPFLMAMLTRTITKCD
jgi:membrane-anchored glycerophosphoryl diester phosphodiesterase (GDPDase)